jgi:multicomponent Na+:H+ antiporter subunit D
VLLRIYYTFFGAGIFEGLPVSNLLLALGIIAALGMSAVAIFQDNAKRLLAYSSVAQLGYIVIGISLVTATGAMASILHLFNHALIKGSLFLVLACVFYRIGSTKVDDMAGLGKSMPFTMAAFVLAGFSLIGIPLTTGFISKWFLINAALEKGWWIVAVVVVAATLMAVIYFWKVIEAVYFRPRPDGALVVTEVPALMLVPLWVLAGANIYFGTNTNLSVGTARRAAEILLGGGG